MPASRDETRTTGVSSKNGTTARPRRFGARDLALIAVFAALIVVLGMPGALFAGSAVPITLQTLGVMLAAALLGWRRAALVALTVIALVAIGLPVLAGGRGGLGVFAGPTVGYLLGWVPGSIVTGLIVERSRRRGPLTMFAAIVLGGVVVIHAFGIPGMMWRAGLDLPAALVADAVYLPGDLAKAVLATVVALTVHRASPDLLPRAERS